MSSGAISETMRNVAGNEDDRAVFADAAREGQREAGEQGRIDMRQDHLEDGAQPAGAEQGGRFFDVAFDLFEDGLHGAHHEGQADEDQRDDDAQRREGDLQARSVRRSSR